MGTGKQMARLLFAVVEGLRGALEQAVLEEVADRLQRAVVPWEGREFSYCFERRRLWMCMIHREKGGHDSHQQVKVMLEDIFCQFECRALHVGLM